ncbi:MAG: undecaprenyl/decaprenyl-phosphate alpha-N-acetylglucosaminyl 1-phosphate transferase [Chitinivibrionales bacterium]|nr:undecaprenyl/decaprenyl-phosphate alpha-N-acetylglucosaminyl 1-phosphate transferase [Chitinivibrionales bacterium]
MMEAKAFIADFFFISFSAFLISFLLTPIIRKKCQKKQIFDIPCLPRKIHPYPIPRLGGIAIYFSFFLPLFAYFLGKTESDAFLGQHFGTLASLLITSSLVFAIGVYDDIRGATVPQKLSVQFFAALLLYFFGFKSQLISIPFFGSESLGFLSFPVTVLWVIGITNAINFIDGIDGLACGVGFFAASTMLILALILQNPLTAIFAAALAGGILGFSYYNFSPASIFLGDSGSLFIGFIIATISLQGSQKSSTVVILLIPIIALGIPIADTLLAIIRRVGNGHSPFKADKDHIHHRLLRLGLSSRQVTLLLYTICILLGVTALSMTAVNNRLLTLILLILGATIIGGMKILGYTADMLQMNAMARERIEQKKRMMKRQKDARRVLSILNTANSFVDLQQCTEKYFSLLDFDAVVFSISNSENGNGNLQCRWQSPGYEEIPEDQFWTMKIPLVFSCAPQGELQTRKAVSANIAYLEDMIMIENFKVAAERVLSRIWEDKGTPLQG